jgi:hypothetical protein
VLQSGMSQEEEASDALATNTGGGSPAVEPLVRHIADLSISGRVGTPTSQQDPPSPTLATENANPNRLDSDSLSPMLSPLGNCVIHRVIRLPSSS